jgi:hypothetical protein
MLIIKTLTIITKNWHDSVHALCHNRKKTIMNAEQYYRHFQLVKEDELIKSLRKQIKKCNKPGEQTTLVLKIYNRSNKIKQKVLAESSENTNSIKPELTKFSRSIDAYFARKVSA